MTQTESNPELEGVAAVDPTARSGSRLHNAETCKIGPGCVNYRDCVLEMSASLAGR